MTIRDWSLVALMGLLAYLVISGVGYVAYITTPISPPPRLHPMSHHQPPLVYVRGKVGGEFCWQESVDGVNWVELWCKDRLDDEK